MKMITLLGVMSLIVFSVTAQEVKLVTKKNRFFREEFSVLASDRKVKHEDYRRYDRKDRIMIEGKFDHDKKIGEWKYYEEGQPSAVFDFTMGEVKFSRLSKTPHNVEEGGKVVLKVLDTPPMYLGSKSRLNDELRRVMTYPESAKRMGIDGVVIASVWIDTTNEVSIKIRKGIQGDCDAQLVKGLRKIEQDWVAGTLDGIPVKSEFLVEFEYKLESSGVFDMVVK